MKKYKSVREELMKIIGSPIERGEEKKAKAVCQEFCLRLKELPPGAGAKEWRHAVTARRYYFKYLDPLIELKLRLMDGDWPGACHTLEQLIYFHPVTQIGIKTPPAKR